MTKSEQIRELASKGFTRQQIANTLGIRYQHVYNVLKRSGLLRSSETSSSRDSVQSGAAPQISSTPVQVLMSKGFVPAGEWRLNGPDSITLDGTLPSEPGVYAFALDGEVVYVGVSERNLRQRIYFCAKPGQRQRTSIRIKALIVENLKAGRSISVCIARPESTIWNDFHLPMHTAVEAGLIRALRPTWNKMGL